MTLFQTPKIKIRTIILIEEGYTVPDYNIYYPKNFEEGNDFQWLINEGDKVLPGEAIFTLIKKGGGHWDVTAYAGYDFKVKKQHLVQNSSVQTSNLLMTISTDDYVDDFMSNVMYRLSLAGPVYAIFEEYPDAIDKNHNMTGVLSLEGDEKVSIYVRAGLDEEFAKSIVNGANPDDILDLWEADWRKQYPSDDPLISAILTSKLTNDDGYWLNSIRSDHELIVLLCADGHITIDFAKALLDSGFDKHPEAVIDVLQGAEPSIIARIRKIEINGELPPALEKVPPREFFD